MNNKLIFFDIDGTLLDESTFTVPQSTLNAISLAQKNGHKCFINTGRPRSTIDKVITDIPFDGYVCGCGTYIEYQNKQLFHVEINDQLREQVIKSSFDCKVDAVLEGKNGVYFPIYSKHPFVTSVKKRYIEAGFPVYDYNREDLVMFDKFAVWYDQDSQIDEYRHILSDHFEIIQRDVDFLEIIPLNYSKGTGIQFIADYLNNTIDNTISIGDSTNDIAMLTYTKESVAMGNSNPLLFPIVTYKTTSIDNDGIYNALKHFEII